MVRNKITLWLSEVGNVNLQTLMRLTDWGNRGLQGVLLGQVEGLL